MYEEECGPLLLSLPSDLLALVASNLGSKSALRLTCRALRCIVDTYATDLTWCLTGELISGSSSRSSQGETLLSQTCCIGLGASRGLGGAAPLSQGTTPLSLAAVLPALCQHLRVLDCSEATALSSLAGCPSTIQTLYCNDTMVADLGTLAVAGQQAAVAGLPPLSAYTRLQTLNCSWTPVADLGPLTACSRLQALNCSSTRVSDLRPLAACLRLQVLNCRNTQVAYLGPLATCERLQTLICSGTLVADLGPLSSCTGLQTLDCNSTAVADLGPLAACTGLRALNCGNCTLVAELGPLAACSSLQALNCSSTAVADLGPLASCPALRSLDCLGTRVADLAPLVVCPHLLQLWCDRHGLMLEQVMLLWAAAAMLSVRRGYGDDDEATYFELG